MEKVLDLVDEIKREMNYNPLYDTEEIKPLINRAIKDIFERTSIGKEREIITTYKDDYDYPLPQQRVSYIYRVFYRKNEKSEHYQLKLVSPRFFNSGIMGYYTTKTTYFSIPYHTLINLTFNPEDNYQLVVEYTNWTFLPDDAFANNHNLNLYLPREIYEPIVDYVVYRLKARDRDEIFVEYKNSYLEKVNELADINQEEAVLIDDIDNDEEII